MDGVTLLGRARAARLTVLADGDRLVVRGPRSAGDVAELLIAHKSTVLDAIHAQQQAPAVADPWVRLLADAGPLRGTLDAFRAQGCALNVVGGRMFFGPYDDFAGCVWRDADAWHAAYAVWLAPHEVTLRDLLARLLEQIETEEMAL